MNASIVRLWAATWVILWAASLSSRAATIPRYAPKPGQLLTYEQNESFTGRAEDSRYKTTWRLWVVGRNDDGSWRFVARESMKTLRDNASPSGEQETVSFARFDLYPNGDVPRSPSLGTRFDASHIFPRLPGDETEAATGWQARDDRDDTTVRYQPINREDKNNAATFDFDGEQSSFMEKIYEGKDRRTFHFDRKKGLLVRAEIARAFGAHMQGRGTGTLELRSDEEMEPTMLAPFREQMDRYFDALRAYHEIYRRAETSGGEAESLLNKARAILADARANVTVPQAVAAFDDALKNHNDYAKYQVEQATQFAAIIGHAAPAWDLKDLDGRPHSLEQYRGKVLVLDFWYRGCGWCMRAMPQVKKIATHYSDRPVAVFGMNNDRSEDDARFVVQKMQLGYPVLRSDELPGKYGVRGFPTLIIIDQKGNVADIHVGYSRHLFEEVKAAVDHLLDSK